ncbi:ABC-2 type transport system permease protein [Antricoccus suffuscus]|uniref:Transport permease protein n=1 Tax=Antricoccus suffuscus TaxID=1629062 RepID=A0A2T1A733_9ACTN|nr:ABC transporter permease [Antricoccus suffuscus]PRZ44364.1 ABC-2 type transport system permease protein [Antricoccus suffuscus]
MATRNPIKEIWHYRGLIGNFASREIKGKYRGSLLGSVWSLLNPLSTLAIYSIVFGFFLRFPNRVAGNGTLSSFPVYLFTALVLWNFFNALVTGSIGALVGAGPLLRKIYFPPFTAVFGSMLAVLNQLMIEIGILVVVFLIAWNISWTILLLPILLALFAAFGLGVGMFFAMLNARFRDVNYIITVLLNLLFYSAPIIYPIELVQAKYGEYPWLKLYEYNPLTVFIESFRNILWDLKFPGWPSMAYMVIVSLLVLAGGWFFFQRRAHDVSEEL